MRLTSMFIWKGRLYDSLSFCWVDLNLSFAMPTQDLALKYVHVFALSNFNEKFWKWRMSNENLLGTQKA